MAVKSVLKRIKYMVKIIIPKMKQMSGITEIEINQYTEVMDTLKREEFI